MKIYVDGCMNKDTKDYAWASVTDENGKDLLEKYKDLLGEFEITKVPTKKRGEFPVIKVKFDDVKHQNNGAELVAMLLGVKIALYLVPEVCQVYSDSSTVIAWSEGRATWKTLSTMNPKKKLHINELKNLTSDLKTMGGDIIKVDGAKNPADLGYHK